MNNKLFIFFGIIGLLYLSSCTNDTSQTGGLKTKQQFSLLSADHSQVVFSNDLTVNDSMNFFKYGYFYMGGGVSTGDLNGDGLSDILFTANMEANKIYINQGDLKFSEITLESRSDQQPWHTGCTFLDVNADGKLDIYISVAGIWSDRSNLLYINQGNDDGGLPIFKEQSKEYGIADDGYTIQSVPLDYDGDGDMDLFVVNYPPMSFDSKVIDYDIKLKSPTLSTSDHLYENKGDGTFVDVTEKSGLLNFGLGIGVLAMDFNEDGHTDLYVSNDFHTPDFMYFNNGDGTFTEGQQTSLQQTSFYGMGIDAVDFTGDGHADLMQVDMTSNDNYRSKTNMASMNIPAFNQMVDLGMGHQYMYNSLQIFQGMNKDNKPFYSNLSRLHGLEMTDWSWACLFGDYDNSGTQDLYITNGVRKDINNKDYFKWLKQTDTKLKVKYKELTFADLTGKMTEEKMVNPIYSFDGTTFVNTTDQWGLSEATFSNGLSYADLDNDGDLDLIVNNIDTTAMILENKNTQGGNFLSVSLVGSKMNPLGLGAKVSIHVGNSIQSREHTLVRGFQSSVDPILHFGLGSISKVEKVEVIWPDGTVTSVDNVAANARIKVEHAQSVKRNKPNQKTDSNLTYFDEVDLFPYVHKENVYDDFVREVLLPHKMSSFSPGVLVADMNNDDKDDLIVTSAKGMNDVVYISGANNSFAKSELASVKENIDVVVYNEAEEKELLFLPSGNEVDDLKDNYYSLTNSNIRGEAFDIEAVKVSGSVLLDLGTDDEGRNRFFVGGRQVPGQYPSLANSYILVKDDKEWKDISEDVAPELESIGMVTDAVQTDYDKDGDLDLLIVGEWMGITIFENIKGAFNKVSKGNLDTQVGWWSGIVAGDFDADGYDEYIVLNLGQNYKYKASDEATFDCYANDFDENKDLDIVLGYHQDGKQFPVRGRQCSSEQIPEIASKFHNYDLFGKAELKDIYTDIKLKEGLHHAANNFSHIYIDNNLGSFSWSPMDFSFQGSSYNCGVVLDVNKDGNLDIVLGGNIFDSEVETPRNDSEFGTVAINDGTGAFAKISNDQTGLYVPYETRDMDIINIGDKKYVIFANNNAPLKTYILK